MKSILVAALYLPTLIAAQGPPPFISVVDSIFHLLETGRAAPFSGTTVSINAPAVETTRAAGLGGSRATTTTSWVTVSANEDATTITSWTTVPADNAFMTIDTVLPTRGLIPIPIAAQISSTVFATGVPGPSPTTSTPNGVVVVPGGVTTITTSTLLTRLGQTVILPPQPMGFPTQWPQDDRQWRLDATAPCERGGKVDGNKAKCRLQRCMWEHTKPLNITRAWPVVEFPISWTNATSASGNSSSALGFVLGGNDYRTFWAHEYVELSGEPHWGTTKEGLYYPYRTLVSSVMEPATTVMNKKATTIIPETGVWQSTIERILPTALPQQYEPAPRCSSLDDCSEQCAAAENKMAKHRRKMQFALLGGLIGGAAVLCLLCCCLCCCRRRRHKDPRDKSNTGVSTVSSTTRSSADPATGSQVVTVTSAGQDQRGDTLGRQAEEGRSRVHFPEDPTGLPNNEKVTETTTATAGPGQIIPSTGQVTEVPSTTASKVVQAPGDTAQHVEAIPAHDGADSWPTGSQRFDMNSMRGRKKMRADLRNLF